jgi:hypothetical protein
MLRLAACLALVAAAVPVLACRGERLPPQPVLAATQADMVVTGTVVEVADEVTMAKSHPDAVDETAYTVATVRIESALFGVKNLTHVRVAVPAGSLDRADAPFRLDGKYLFFLQQHSASSLMLPSRTHAPVDLNRLGSSDILRRVTVATTAMIDPVKALKAADQEDRTLAAVALVQWYRRIPAAPKGYEAVGRPAEESRLLFAALAEAEWTAAGTPETGNIYGLMHGMGLEQQGFNLSGQNGADPAKLLKDRFTAWLAADGKTARMKQFVAKK